MFVFNVDTEVQNRTGFLYFDHEYISFMEFKVVIPEPQNKYVHCCYLKLEQKAILSLSRSHLIFWNHNIKLKMYFLSFD